MGTIIVALDGPAGSGKTSVAKRIARELNGYYLDTGAMYRAFAWAVLQEGISLDKEDELKEVFAKHKFEFLFKEEKSQKIMEVRVDGKILVEELRTPEVDNAVSRIAKFPFIRKKMLEWQREMASQVDFIVVDGRDIGTVVFPQAQVKIFLTASPEERARRRLKEKGLSESEFERIKKEIEERDRRDSERRVAPLKKADDAILLDTSNMNLDEVVAEVKKIIKNKLSTLGVDR